MTEFRQPERIPLAEACRVFHAELAAYLEGESRPAVEQHARVCAFCSVLLADLEMLRQEASHLPLEEPPLSLWEGIVSRLAAEGARQELLPACLQFHSELSDYLEGAPSPAVARHAQECSFCGAVLADLEMLRRESQSLPEEEPPARLWANVRAQLAEEGTFKQPARGWARWFAGPAWAHAAAPAGALACLFLFGLTLLVPPHSVDRSSAWLSSSDRRQVAHRVMLAEDSALVSTVNQLQANFETEQNRLAPTIRATYQKGLASLDQSISECRASVEQEPANQLARQMLIAAYSRKAEVLASAMKFDVP